MGWNDQENLEKVLETGWFGGNFSEFLGISWDFSEFHGISMALKGDLVRLNGIVTMG
jgi:hypothetical protein